MARQFTHLDEVWTVTPTGAGHSVGVGDTLPAIDRWGVILRSPTHEPAEFRTWISAADPADATEQELKDALEEQLILAAINRSRYIWRPAEAIAGETGIATERVRQMLEDSVPDVIAGDRNDQGLWLYTTGDHLARSAGDVLKHFYQVEESS